MKKLYDKNELYFALAAIGIYVLVMGNLRANLGDDSILALLFLAAFASGITAFILRSGLRKKYGLVKPGNPRAYLYYVPLALLCTVNLWFGIRLHCNPGRQLIAMVSMLLVGYVEELIFRGLLFKAIEKDSLRQAIVISAVTFGVGHLVNLLTGRATLETILQVFYAITIGLSFVLLFYKSGSLIPAMVTHSIINMTSVLSNNVLPEHTARLYDLGGTIFILVITLLYSAWLVHLKDS